MFQHKQGVKYDGVRYVQIFPPHYIIHICLCFIYK